MDDKADQMARMTPEELAAKNAKNKAAWNRAGVTRAEVAKVTNGKVGKLKPLIPTEHQEQCAVIEWCDQHPIAKRIFAIPNGSNKSPAAAAKFKREGLRKGVPDLFLPVARRGFHGLFIEMKHTKGSAVSPEQVAWVDYLFSAGYVARTARGADDAIAMISDYLKET